MTDQPGDVPYTCADVAKAEHFLGYKATVPFEEGIKRTVEWYREAYPQYSNLRPKNVTKKVAPLPLPTTESPIIEAPAEKEIPDKTSEAESPATKRPVKQHHSEDDDDEVCTRMIATYSTLAFLSDKISICSLAGTHEFFRATHVVIFNYCLCCHYCRSTLVQTPPEMHGQYA